MEYTPICLECDNFKKGDKCKYYSSIPFKIKNREIRCPYFSGGDYDLLGEGAYLGKENKHGKGG